MIILIFASVFFPACLAETIESGLTIHLNVGEQRIIKAPDLASFSLGADIVRSVSFPNKIKSDALKGSILLKAVKPGITNLWLYYSDGRSELRTIQVSAWDQNRVLGDALTKELQNLYETEIVFSPSSIFLRGEIHTRAELKTLRRLRISNPDRIQDLTSLSPQLLAEGLEKLRQAMKQRNVAETLTVKEEFGQIVLGGTLKSASEAEKLESYMASRFEGFVSRLKYLPGDSTVVHLKVYLLEIRKAALLSLGMEWPAQLSGAFHAAPWKISQNLGLDVAVNALEARGQGRILSRPELSVRAPGKAELFAGGEIPIQIRDNRNLKVEWKPVGVRLILAVTNLAGNRVRLNIETEVSQTDYSRAVENLPALQKNTMKTEVDSEFEIPLLLSGMLQLEHQESKRGLPFLSRIPLLGLLFGSQDFQESQSELVAVLLPKASPPETSLARFQSPFPRGPVPLPDTELTPDQEEKLAANPDYPWNVF